MGILILDQEESEELVTRKGGFMFQRISTLAFAFAITAALSLRAQAQNTPTATLGAAAPAIATTEFDNTQQIASRTVLIVHEFSVNEKAGWPYDVKQLQSQTIAELRAKSGGGVDVLVSPPETPRTHTYTLDGEIVSWHPGNRAKRMMVGLGSGRETADIHYWLTDGQGKRVFEHKDTIRAEFWGNAYAGSVGELSHPFASKIAARLTDAKVF
jgi:uncharacterized protein DUF4410